MPTLWGTELQGMLGPHLSGGNGEEEGWESGRMEAGKLAWWWGARPQGGGQKSDAQCQGYLVNLG